MCVCVSWFCVCAGTRCVQDSSFCRAFRHFGGNSKSIFKVKFPTAIAPGVIKQFPVMQQVLFSSRKAITLVPNIVLNVSFASKARNSDDSLNSKTVPMSDVKGKQLNVIRTPMSVTRERNSLENVSVLETVVSHHLFRRPHT